MQQFPSFNELIEKSIINHWDSDALTDYKGKTLQYHDVARKIEKIHIMFEASGVQKGDKIALCGRNSSMWAAAFLATLTYGAVAVPILHEFTPEQIHNIVNHSEAKILFVGDVVATEIDNTKMPALEGIFYLPDLSLILSRTEKLTFAREHLNEMFGKKYPKYFRAEHVRYYREQSPDELALINYTSGTTGNSKGVMIPYRAMWSNADFARSVLGSMIKPGSHIISILPMAHMYGMAFELIFEFISGAHIFYLTRMPSPAIIAQALAEIKPVLMIAVPLIIEKIIRKRVFPKIQNSRMKVRTLKIYQARYLRKDQMCYWDITRTMKPPAKCLMLMAGSILATLALWTPTITFTLRGVLKICFWVATGRTSTPKKLKTNLALCHLLANVLWCNVAINSLGWFILTLKKRKNLG